MIFNNRPLTHLNEENDLFGLYEKAELILKVFNKQSDLVKQNKMFAIYGEWGTGKTTLLRYLQTNVRPKKYTTIFFEAWENEKDDNLALSLSDLLRMQLNEDAESQKLGKKFYKISSQFLKGFAKGISVKFTPPVPGLSNTSIHFSPEKIVDEFNNEKSASDSFSKSLSNFKLAYRALEDEIIKHNKLDEDGKIIVFVDDLDRCEPDNVLNLISALKLFFTYGEKTLFFCGIDKDAVRKAIQSKYLDVIKADEYLEKVFDVTFNLPSYISVKKIFDKYFQSITPSEQDIDLGQEFETFLSYIDFNTPRHIKKVLNKYSIINYLSEEIEDHTKPQLIGASSGKGNVVDTILTMFLLILKEYYQNEYYMIYDINKKIANYAEIYSSNKNAAAAQHHNISMMRTLLSGVYYNTSIKDIIQFKYQSIKSASIEKADPKNSLIDAALYFLFLPLGNNSHMILEIKNENAFIDQFNDSEHSILVRFCHYLKDNLDRLSNYDEYQSGDFTLINLFTFLDKIT
ncbi:MAG: KAP family NTPase [Chitinophagales bacterium]|nr:KAP family NTPase [Chitinophagales bacterium]